MGNGIIISLPGNSTTLCCHLWHMIFCLLKSSSSLATSQAAATVSLLREDLELVVDADAWRSPFFDVIITLRFSFLSSCFICCALHSWLQNAVSPLQYYHIEKKKVLNTIKHFIEEEEEEEKNHPIIFILANW